jgi:hypothetical protein
VLPLKTSTAIIKRKIEDKKKLLKFAERYGKGTSLFNQGGGLAPGTTFESLKDLV